MSFDLHAAQPVFRTRTLPLCVPNEEQTANLNKNECRYDGKRLVGDQLICFKLSVIIDKTIELETSWMSFHVEIRISLFRVN